MRSSDRRRGLRYELGLLGALGWALAGTGAVLAEGGVPNHERSQEEAAVPQIGVAEGATSTRERILPPGAPFEVLPGGMNRPTSIPENRGVWVGTPDRRFTFRLSGFGHLDGRWALANGLGSGGSLNTFPRRLRFAPEGTLFGNVDYRLMFDVAVDVAPLDAYVDWRLFSLFNLRLGKFKSPLGFERRARAFALLFVERAFPNLLAPNRDVGAFLHGQSVGGFFSYELALLAGAADMESINGWRGRPDLAGRVYLQPFRLSQLEALRHFGLGLSATAGREEGEPEDPRLGRFQTSAGTRFARYRGQGEDESAAFARGNRRRWSAHGHWRHRRYFALGEYVRSQQEVARDDLTVPLAHQSWQVAFRVALTPHENGFFGIRPSQVFDPARGQWGAFSVAVRYTELYLDRRTFPHFADPDQAARSVHGGAVSLQWFLTNQMDLQWDLERNRFRGGAPGGDAPSETAALMRLQALF